MEVLNLISDAQYFDKHDSENEFDGYNDDLKYVMKMTVQSNTI